jgi:hypothetical protein
MVIFVEVHTIKATTSLKYGIAVLLLTGQMKLTSKWVYSSYICVGAVCCGFLGARTS